MWRSAFEIDHPCGVKISPDLTEDSFNAATKGNAEIQVRDMKNGWVWYSLPLMQSINKSIKFSLAFHNGLLREMSVTPHDAVLYGRNWNDWSAEREQLRAKHAEEWLRDMGFSADKKYSWGEVWAGYDPKGGFGHAIVRYKK